MLQYKEEKEIGREFSDREERLRRFGSLIERRAAELRMCAAMLAQNPEDEQKLLQVESVLQKVQKSFEIEQVRTVLMELLVFYHVENPRNFRWPTS